MSIGLLCALCGCFSLFWVTVDVLAYCRPRCLVAFLRVAVDAKMSGNVCRAHGDDEGHFGCIGDCRRVRTSYHGSHTIASHVSIVRGNSLNFLTVCGESIGFVVHSQGPNVERTTSLVPCCSSNKTKAVHRSSHTINRHTYTDTQTQTHVHRHRHTGTRKQTEQQTKRRINRRTADTQRTQQTTNPQRDTRWSRTVDTPWTQQQMCCARKLSSRNGSATNLGRGRSTPAGTKRTQSALPPDAHVKSTMHQPSLAAIAFNTPAIWNV